MRKYLIWILIIAGLSGGTLLFVSANNDKAQPVRPNRQIATPESGSKKELAEELSIGSVSAPATIYEYADFKCPKCNLYQQQAGKKIRRDFVETGKVKIVFRPFPVFGEDAGLVLYGSYCASEQGKFTSYYDAMFATMAALYADGDYSEASENILTPDEITVVAEKTGLEPAAFRACLSGNTHKADFDAAQHASAEDSVQGTPTIVIAGKAIVGAQPYEIYKTLIEAQL